MSKSLRHIVFSVILLFLFWVWIKTSHGDEEETEYNENAVRVFSVLLSSTRNHQKARCRIPNPDDPKGEILKGVYCPTRLKIMDRNNPFRKCVGILIGKHRAMDGDLTFDVLPNDEYRYLINNSNIKRKKGALHCEIVTDDRIKLEDIYKRIELNSVVEVEGVWVEDTQEHNWTELHPVTTLKLIRKRN